MLYDRSCDMFESIRYGSQVLCTLVALAVFLKEYNPARPIFFGPLPIASAVFLLNQYLAIIFGIEAASIFSFTC